MSNFEDTITVDAGPCAASAKTPSRRRSRAVSNLTRQQIQQKRDQDRKAQRALRERNKTRVESLESTLAQLRATQAEEAEALQGELRALQAENRQLKDRVGRLSESREQSNTATPPDLWTTRPAGLPPIEELADQQPWEHGWYASPSAATTGQGPRQHDPDTQPARELRPGNFMVQEGSLPQTDSHRIAAAPSPQSTARDGPLSTVVHPTASMSDAACQTETNTAIFLALPNHLPPVNPLDHILLGFLRFYSATGPGEITRDVAGSPQVSLKAYLHPELSDSIDPISRVMNEVLSTFRHVSAPEKISFMYVMHRTMRWQVHPTETTYTDLPRWLRPTATQITVPHAAWIDNIPWPGVRDMLIETPDKYPFQVFSSVYSQCVTVNWPYDAEDAFTEVGEDVVPNRIFEKHIQRLGNWTVSRHFEEHYPEMVRCIYSRD